jgi:hypothetical protein
MISARAAVCRCSAATRSSRQSTASPRNSPMWC